MISDIDGVELFYDLKVLREAIPAKTIEASDMLDYIKRINYCFANIWVAYSVLLTIHVTVASTERSFSKLNLIKSIFHQSCHNIN